MALVQVILQLEIQATDDDVVEENLLTNLAIESAALAVQGFKIQIT